MHFITVLLFLPVSFQCVVLLALTIIFCADFRAQRAGVHVPSIRPVQVPVALHVLVVSSAGSVQQAAAIHFPAVEEAQQEKGGHLGWNPLWCEVPGLPAPHHQRLLERPIGPGRWEPWLVIWLKNLTDDFY